MVLAGGRGRRIGGAKAVVPLAGRPLISYPLRALSAALEEVWIVAKPGTELPVLDGIDVWPEPPEPRHPLVGIVHALRMARTRPVLVCAADMPFLTPAAVAQLAGADPGGAPAVVAARGQALQPLLGLYQPEAADLLAPAAAEAKASLRSVVRSIGALPLDMGPDADTLFFNVNSAEDLRHAEGLLAPPRHPLGYPKVKS